MSDLSQKLINGDTLDSFAKKLNDKIQEDIKEVDTKVSTHNHNDKYYTESEIDTKLANKADKEHGTHLTLGTGSGNAFRGDYGNTAYNHSQAAHAPSNAQKNSDITKAEIEAKLTGAITSHTHNYAGSSSAGGAATSANKVNTNLAIKLNGGTTEGTNLFTFNGSTAKTINITPSSIGAAASSHGTHLTLGTGAGNAYYGDKGKIAYDHSQAAHAPSNAQKNSDITKAEIEAKLTGEIATHTHAGESIYYLPADVFTVTTGSKTSGSYLSTKWNAANANGITEPYDGMTIAIRVPSAGISTAGVVLSIDGGATYHPIVKNVDTVLSTYYAVGTTIIVTYNSTQTAVAYLTSNTKTTPAGVWQIADYDTDNDKKSSSSNKVNTKMFIIGASSQSTSGQTTYSNANCYIGDDNCLYSNGLKVVDSDELAFRDRTHTPLYPTGTKIPANADLNSVDYLKVGCYFCSKTADAKTIANCPVKVAFMMEVLSPISATFDDETSDNYVYRLRRITHYSTGRQYIQYVGSGATVGAFTYNEWREVAFVNDIPDIPEAATEITTDIIDQAFTGAGL